jgi:Domain of unknown function (DUF4259)
MGAWSTSSFDNDIALDWVCDLKNSSNYLEFLGSSVRSQQRLEKLVAAAEAACGLFGTPGARIPVELVEWCQGKPPVSETLRGEALQALQALLENRDADVHEKWFDLGENNEQYRAWVGNIQNLVRRLEERR